jgi:hypothetical protein
MQGDKHFIPLGVQSTSQCYEPLMDNFIEVQLSKHRRWIRNDYLPSRVILNCDFIHCYAITCTTLTVSGNSRKVLDYGHPECAFLAGNISSYMQNSLLQFFFPFCLWSYY